MVLRMLLLMGKRPMERAAGAFIYLRGGIASEVVCSTR